MNNKKIKIKKKESVVNNLKTSYRNGLLGNVKTKLTMHLLLSNVWRKIML
jgi:hypothetical protein